MSEELCSKCGFPSKYGKCIYCSKRNCHTCRELSNWDECHSCLIKREQKEFKGKPGLSFKPWPKKFTPYFFGCYNPNITSK